MSRENCKRPKFQRPARWIMGLLLVVAVGITNAWAAAMELNPTQCGAASGGSSCIGSCSGYIQINTQYGRYRVFGPCGDEYNRYGTNYCTCQYKDYSSQAAADSAKCNIVPNNPNCNDKGRADAKADSAKYYADCLKKGGVPKGGGVGLNTDTDTYQFTGGVCDYCEKNSDGKWATNKMQQRQEEQTAQCCRQGNAPVELECDNSSLHDPYGSGESVVRNRNCNTLGNVDVSTGVIDGCQEYVKGPDINSSGSGGGDSTWSSSSDGETTIGDIGQDLEDIKDSLHKMMQLDTMIMGLDTIRNQYLQQILRELQQDSMVVNVQGDTIIVKPADVHFNPTIQGDTIIVNNDSLAHAIDSLWQAIRGLGGDSTTYNDSAVVGAITALDSGIFGGWDGNIGDTSGWMGKFDSVGRALDSMASGKGGAFDGCDTTGGKKCDGVLIGSHGLDSARNGARGAYRAMMDSVTKGPLGDSIKNWQNEFQTNVLNGSGTNNCPSVLTRTFEVPIGNVKMQVGGLGKYLCAPIIGSMTPWSLARTLIRTIVSFMCMMWLFKQTIGAGSAGGGEDED